MGGAFGSEYGIGRVKLDLLSRYSNSAKIAVVWAIKRALDPKGILSPGKVVR
ncbi:FAD-linked oxidase C-terminal domain-containing protein [Azorhizobium oxalatiphilum]|nr:FAD-linked oxidase C-terminal domain-containing protein [Azorhizobium oxalatiphilum]